MFWLVATLVLLCLFYYYDRNRFRHWERKNVKQTMPTPIFGDYGKLMFGNVAISDILKNLYDSFDNVRYIGHYQYYQPILLLKDPKLIKQICVKDFEHFLDHRSFTTEEDDPLWSKNLFSLKGQKWREMRSTLSPFFTGKKMRQMFVLMHDCSKNFVQYLTSRNEDFMELELYDSFTRYSNDIIASTAFGIDCNSLKNKDNEFFVNGKSALDFSGIVKSLKFMLLLLPKVTKIVKVTFFDADISEFFRNVVKESLKYREENKIERPDILNLLIQARKGNQKDDEEEVEETNFAAVEEYEDHKVPNKRKLDLTLDDITSQVLIFFLAGLDTVSTVLSFVAYELALNPDVQKKLIEELDDFRASNDKFTYEGLAKLPYLDMVLSEVLRKWPPTVSTDRYCNKPYLIEPELEGETPLQIDVGEIVMIMIYAIQRDPKYWENPDKFDPERFSPENKHKIDPYAYIPFGVGPRNCIGSRYALTEVKVLFYEILAKFEIVPTKKSLIPFVSDSKTFTLNSSKGFWFGLKKRDV